LFKEDIEILVMDLLSRFSFLERSKLFISGIYYPPSLIFDVFLRHEMGMLLASKQSHSISLKNGVHTQKVLHFGVGSCVWLLSGWPGAGRTIWFCSLVPPGSRLEPSDMSETYFEVFKLISMLFTTNIYLY
jgi:hypothetical protein